ncbi:hypothetical protein [Sulfurovum sp.]|uniref:hypothetical protein n=1 Tax=Sulfurovum sp. TaxID=1969726 RepID=UPI002867E24E|nr:hypothetical protein [Sulfurovum sp.]
MKNILIGVILTSSLAVSGNVKKCSEAMEMMDKYFELHDDADNDMQRGAYKAIENEWKKQGRKECKGVLNELQSVYFFGK